uniref:G_PROTEIN_RECEP_F1_2 domain-containing protein n=1 Tax=Haemonchus placei TaxID=6290 RepID=A0A0N4WTI4_HAEPC
LGLFTKPKNHKRWFWVDGREGCAQNGSGRVTDFSRMLVQTHTLTWYMKRLGSRKSVRSRKLRLFFSYPPYPYPFQSYDYVPLLAGWEHYQIFNFYVMTVLHIFVPFAILVILNISIVVLTKRKLHGVSWAMATLVDMPKVTELIRKESMMSSKKRRDEVRYATWTMVSITTTYLCCSSLSLFISVMENVFPHNSLLFHEDGSSTRFYTLASDVVSILVAVNSLLRLPVYMLCSPNLRYNRLVQIPCVQLLSRRKEEVRNERR